MKTMTAPDPKPDPVIVEGVPVDVVPERAATYVNPVTGQSGLTFKELAAQLPELYPDVTTE